MGRAGRDRQAGDPAAVRPPGSQRRARCRLRDRRRRDGDPARSGPGRAPAGAIPGAGRRRRGRDWRRRRRRRRRSRASLGRAADAAACGRAFARRRPRAAPRFTSCGRTASRPCARAAGIPSLERALGDAEVSGVASWVDAPSDAAWTSPDPAAVLRAIDRFRPVPDVPARAASWAEWLYFNGRSSSARFYLTFLVGPAQADGRRTAGVRLQLDRGKGVESFSAHGRTRHGCDRGGARAHDWRQPDHGWMACVTSWPSI